MHDSRPRCLLVAPLTFYSFHRTLASALEKRGYSVDLLNEEYPDNVIGKVLGKLALPVLRLTTLRELKKRLAQRPPYDLTVIIKGRGLGPPAIACFRACTRRIVGYNFDSFEYNPSAWDWYSLVDRYATFDINDARVMNLPLVHLFSAAPASLAATERVYDLSIVQRVHSDRLAYAARILDTLPNDARTFVFLYQSSKLLFLFGIMRHPHLYWRLWRHISFKPLPYADAMRVLASSRVTLDFAHPRQSGITVRCFEAQSVGTAILTNNRAAVESGLFSPGSIAYMPFDGSFDAIRQAIASLGSNTPEPAPRTLDDFLDDLLSEAPELTHQTDQRMEA